MKCYDRCKNLILPERIFILILTKLYLQASNVLGKEGWHLMSKLLLYDPERRITAREALAHPYFTSPVAEEGTVTQNNM